MHPIVILDRDGTLIEDTGYLRDPEPVKLLPHVVEGFRLIRRKGYFIYVVSNQSGVGRGLITMTEFEAVHEKVVKLLSDENLFADGYGYCFHKPEDLCKCRKPEIGLVPEELLGKRLDHSKGYVVGDRLGDLQLGHKLGMSSWLILTGVGKKTHTELSSKKLDAPWHSCENLLDFAKRIPQSSL